MNTIFRIRLLFIRFRNFADQAFRYLLNRPYSIGTIAELNVNLIIRLAEPDARQIGYDNEFDEVVNLACLKAVYPELFNEDLREEFLKERTPENKDYFVSQLKKSSKYLEIIDGLIEQAKKLEAYNKWVSVSLLCRHYVKNITHFTQACDVWLLLEARKYIPDAKPLLKPDVSRLRKQGDLAFDQLLFELTERDAIKIDIKGSYISTGITLLSSIILVIGYFYTIWFYGHFNIEVHKFLGIADYLSASLEQIHIVLQSTLLSAVFLFAGLNNSSRKSVAQIRHEHSKPDYPIIFIWIGIVLININVILTPEFRYLRLVAVSFDILIIGYLIAPKIARHYFKQNIPAWFVIAMAFVIFSNLFRVVYTDIEKIKKIKDDENYCEGVTFAPSSKLHNRQCEVVLLGASSNYVFFLEKKSQMSIAIPRSQVIHYTIKESDGASIYEWINEKLDLISLTIMPERPVKK
ncbi:MAG: hypothetical protein COB46_09135 [Rhodospirillaceae bacterium]|nr:MAG: hypothetical protein COB46_09135 [Rhodospirillaceae bacterium]